jgi:hypothetical protein
MQINDYVLYGNHAWKVFKKHKKGTFQIKRLSGSPLQYWGDMEMHENLCIVITKEVADVFIASNTDVTNN